MKPYLLEIEDIVVFETKMKECDHCPRLTETRTRQSKIRQSSLHFVGHAIIRHGISPCPQILSAITALETPKNMRSGGDYCIWLSQTLHPVNELLGTGMAWMSGSRKKPSKNKNTYILSTCAPGILTQNCPQLD